MSIGVTLGHSAGMLAAQMKKLEYNEYHWMQLHGASSWVHLADAIMVLNNGVDVEHFEGLCGVFVDPCNGITFSGGLATVRELLLQKVRRSQ